MTTLTSGICAFPSASESRLAVAAAVRPPTLNATRRARLRTEVPRDRKRPPPWGIGPHLGFAPRRIFGRSHDPWGITGLQRNRAHVAPEQTRVLGPPGASIPGGAQEPGE